MKRVSLGGSCHWCTEAIFQSLKGVTTVFQGWEASTDENTSFSEAVTIDYDETIITLKSLVEIHLHTHSSTSNHSFRKKYRSAVYYYSEEQRLKFSKLFRNCKMILQKQLSPKCYLLNLSN